MSLLPPGPCEGCKYLKAKIAELELQVRNWKKRVFAEHKRYETMEDAIKAKDEASAIIQDKCEQYWNAHNIGDVEIHAVLEFIHIQTGG